MNLNKLAEQGEEYLSQLEEERKTFILRNNEIQQQFAHELWEEFSKNNPIEKSPEQKKTNDPE